MVQYWSTWYIVVKANVRHLVRNISISVSQAKGDVSRCGVLVGVLLYAVESRNEWFQVIGSPSRISLFGARLQGARCGVTGKIDRQRDERPKWRKGIKNKQGWRVYSVRAGEDARCSNVQASPLTLLAEVTASSCLDVSQPRAHSGRRLRPRA